MTHTKQQRHEDEVWGGIEEIARIAVDCGFKLHDRLGPGLLESVYELIMFDSLRRAGLDIVRQAPIDITYEDRTITDAFRVDLMVEGKLLIELKSVETLAAVHRKQLLTYLRLTELPLGLLMNFGAATFQQGCKRIINNRVGFVSSFLRVRQTEGQNSEPI